MATLPPGTAVELKAEARLLLRYPPPATDLFVAVHSLALRSPRNALTLAVHVGRRGLDWVGALDESMVRATGTPPFDARPLLGPSLLTGERLWHCVIPGALLLAEGNVETTVYLGSRPWFVVGEIATAGLLAMPINDATPNPKWFLPQIAAEAIPTNNPKLSHLELNHLWTFPLATRDIGTLDLTARPALEAAIRKFYS